MYSNERAGRILDILKEYNYVTVKHLISTMNYSVATINRDLNLLEKQGLVKRYYGGVELVNPNYIPMNMRYYKMKHEKHVIAQEAAKHVKNGDRIFIDCATTTYFLSQHIRDRKNLTVITNSVGLVSELSAHRINVICLGGKIAEVPYGLCSAETIRSAASYKVDKMFFSTGAFYKNGTVGTGLYYDLSKTMMDNSEKIYYLADRGKLERPTSRILCDFSEIDYFFTDYDFDKDIKRRFKNTSFIKVDT